jgi:hypothetical protein
MRRVLWCGLTLMLLLAPVVARADYKKSFAQGMAAKDKGDWQGVMANMNQAIAERSSEGGIFRIGMFPYEYYPHYWLGVAYYRLGNFPAAGEQLAESERQGAIKANAALYAQLRELKQSVGARGGPEPPKEAKKEPPKPDEKKPGPDPSAIEHAAERARNQIERAEQVQKSVVEQRDSPDYAPLWQHDPSLQALVSDASQKLAGVRARLQKATEAGDVAEIDGSGEAALVVRNDLANLIGTLPVRKQRFEQELNARNQERETAERAALDKKKKDEEELARIAAEEARAAQEKIAQEKAEFERQQLLQQLQRRIDTASTILSMLSRATGDPGAARARNDINALISKANALGPNAPAEDLRSLAARLAAAMSAANEQLARVAEASGGPPPVLVDAAASFFSGDYQRTVSVLEKATFSDARATAHALLLRAAARYALFAVGGNQDANLRSLAAADVRGCRHRDPKLVPQGRAFSPGFAEFFRQNG